MVRQQVWRLWVEEVSCYVFRRDRLIDFLNRGLEMDDLAEFRRASEGKRCEEMLELGDHSSWQFIRLNRKNWWAYKLFLFKTEYKVNV